MDSESPGYGRVSNTLTVMVDGVDESDAYVGMVVSYKHNVKELLTFWVELPQSVVYCLQCLRKHAKYQMKRCRINQYYYKAKSFEIIT